MDEITTEVVFKVANIWQSSRKYFTFDIPKVFYATDYLTLTIFITGWWTGDGYGQFEKSHKDSGKLQRFFLYL